METRLRVTEELATTVRDGERPWVSCHWLVGCNPLLGENTPRQLIQSLTGSEMDTLTIEKLTSSAEDFAAATN